jgi:cysteine desulfurase
MSNKKKIYLDNASTTPIDPRVLKEVVFHLKNTAGNAGSIHEEGVAAKKVLEESRRKTASFLRAHPDEIVFTSGGTESNNLAILGVVNSFEEKRSDLIRRGGQERSDLVHVHAITTAVEHSSVLECFRELEKRGVKVTYLPVSSEGIIDLSVLKKSLRPETFLVSIQYANNEIGAIQPIREISKMLRNFRNQRSKFYVPRFTNYPILHTDVSQAACYLDCNVEWLGVDLLTLDGHKVYGPKGIGALYVRRGTPISPIIFGGGQEKNLRPGTENVPLIAGLAKALEICAAERDKESLRLTKLRDLMYSNLPRQIGMTKMILNGDLKSRLPNNLNFSIKEVDTEFLTLQLDTKGIAVSTKSACLGESGSSYVVKAITKDVKESWRARRPLRITLGRWTKKADCQKLVLALREIFKK